MSNDAASEYTVADELSPIFVDLCRRHGVEPHMLEITQVGGVWCVTLHPDYMITGDPPRAVNAFTRRKWRP